MPVNHLLPQQIAQQIGFRSYRTTALDQVLTATTLWRPGERTLVVKKYLGFYGSLGGLDEYCLKHWLCKENYLHCSSLCPLSLVGMCHKHTFDVWTNFISLPLDYYCQKCTLRNGLIYACVMSYAKGQTLSCLPNIIIGFSWWTCWIRCHN